MGTLTPNKGYSLPTVGGDTGVWGNENNASFTVLDNNMGGFTTVNVAGGANVTATAAQAQNLVQSLTGLLTANIQYILPSLGGFYVIENNSTGAFTITVATVLAGATVVAPQGQSVWVYCDGTNIYAPTKPVTFFGVASVSVAGSSNVTAAPTNYALTVQKLTGLLTGNIQVHSSGYRGRMDDYECHHRSLHHHSSGGGRWHHRYCAAGRKH